MSLNCKMQVCQWNGVKRIKIVFSQISGIVEKDFGYLFITSSSSHFFNKTDAKQYLFKNSTFATIRLQFETRVRTNWSSNPLRS